MNPILFAKIVQYIGLAISAARELEPAVVAARNFIKGLFDGGVITMAQQNAVEEYVDAVAKAGIAGEPPPQWTVEDDPEG